jgi:phosphate acetyltransferase
MKNIIDEIRTNAKKLNKHIVLAEGEEPRTIKAAAEILKLGLAKLTLIGDEIKIATLLKELKLKPDALKDAKIFNPKNNDLTKYKNRLLEIRKAKGLTEEEAAKLVLNPLYLAALIVELGEADGMVAGAINSTGNVLRPALQIIKTGQVSSIVSSFFLMVMPKDNKYAKTTGTSTFLFADCGVNINPNENELAQIALQTASSAKRVAGLTPKVAMLSFSTHGSAKDAVIDKVINATKIAKELQPKLIIDGELQADAAIIDTVAALKAPKSELKGMANVLVFPNLESGNIAYKLVERLAGAQAIGPICQGFKKPVNDLSRGCNSDDIVNTVAITCLQTQF